jgi:hypothetical protein
MFSHRYNGICVVNYQPIRIAEDNTDSPVTRAAGDPAALDRCRRRIEDLQASVAKRNTMQLVLSVSAFEN